MHANRIRMIGQSEAKSSPTSPAEKTNASPIPEPRYLQQPMQGVNSAPKKSPKHIKIIISVKNDNLEKNESLNYINNPSEIDS